MPTKASFLEKVFPFTSISLNYCVPIQCYVFIKTFVGSTRKQISLEMCLCKKIKKKPYENIGDENFECAQTLGLLADIVMIVKRRMCCLFILLWIPLGVPKYTPKYILNIGELISYPKFITEKSDPT